MIISVYIFKSLTELHFMHRSSKNLFLTHVKKNKEKGLILYMPI